ncbi:MAG TPA: HTTM domain-containing protein, partial [Gemmataceae bacterium]
ESEWAARVDKILKASPDLTEFDPEIPPFIRSQPPEARELFQGEVIRFLRVLPRDREQRGYVLEFFQDNLAASEQLREFINGLPVDAAERMAVLDYVALWNFDPAQAWAHGQPIFSIWYHVTSPAGMWATHAAILVIMALFTLGFCTRITSVLTWLAAVSYIHRSNQVLFGMDTMMNILLFYLMIAPSGAALSIDRLIERYRILRASYRRSGRVDELARAALAGPRPSVTANLVTRMMQIHFCIIYIAAGLSKLKGETWWAHYAPWLTMVNPEFSPVTLPVYLDLMEWLGGQRLLHALVMFFGVGFTLTLEIGFPFLVWTRLRPYMVMGSVLLHFMIVVFMGLSVFSLFMMALVLCFISPQAVRERLTAGAGLPRLRLRFHSAQPRQLRRASLVGAADVADQVELIDEAPKGEKAPREAAPISVSAQGGGDARSGFGAFALLLRSLRLLRPFAWLLWVPGFAALGRALYPSRPAKPPSGDAGAAAPGDKAKTVA